MSAPDDRWLFAANAYLNAGLEPIPLDVAAVLTTEDAAELRERTEGVLFERFMVAVLSPVDEGKLDRA